MAQTLVSKHFLEDGNCYEIIEAKKFLNLDETNGQNGCYNDAIWSW